MKPASWRKLHSKVWFDLRLVALGPEARVCYGTLLLLASDEGHLPPIAASDLAHLVGLPSERTQELLRLLVAFGYVSYAEGQHTVASQAQDHAFSESRRAGGRARYDIPDAKHRAKHPGQDAKHLAEDAKHPPSGTSGREKKTEAQRVKQTQELALSRQVSDAWCESFMRARGAKYVWQGGKDGKALATLLKANPDLADIRARIDRFLADPFWAPKADWTKFCSQFNAMAPSRPFEPEHKPIETEVVQDFIRRRDAHRMAQGSGPSLIVDPRASQGHYEGRKEVG